MNFLNKIYAWILKNYIKVISFLLVIGLAYGTYLYFFFMAQKKDQEAGDLFLTFIILIRPQTSMSKNIKLLQMKFLK